ncbi:metallophosphoesterase [Methanothermobacter tenebrarum]|uniref:Phosphoesterase n=1 Tax=Methanothermobacter tenebrarum TaxID=680118 RepID=A0A328PIS5_9EURY|nr:metallophosphoesterase [Methanothermobacter tenebrarum]MBC7101068.1 metallophosphoesterase [Methanobacteriales archaeon]MBC7118012.1 metallophosphoesterase [Methanobacteriaceae archaeon]RAO79775.1 YfcE family phosphodiesterase [Methanothermobacter tenebrarum]
MLVGVVSDTHVPDRVSVIPDKVFEVFSSVDMILHAGDLTSLDVKDELNNLAPMKCVQGNMDRYYGLELPRDEILKVDGLSIGLNHGEVYPRGDTQQLKYIALEMNVDVLISGHTHQPFIKEVDGILLLNPGSPTVPRLAYPTVMLVEIYDGKIETEIVRVGSPTCKIR